MIFAIGAKQFVVQEAFDKMVSSFVIDASFKPKTIVFTDLSAGEEMITFLAPAFMCSCNFSRSLYLPLHSITISIFKSLQGNAAGSFDLNT